MKLAEVLRLIEQEMGMEDPNQKVLEFPKSNLSVSLFRNEKKLIVSPMNPTTKNDVRSVVSQIKDRGFKVLKVVPQNPAFEIDLDKSENFDTVVQFLQQNFS